MDESKLLYTATHEWVLIGNDEVCTVGITRFAADQLTDIVYVELPALGTQLKPGQTFGVIESVKAVSDLYSPCTGEVVAVNQAIVDNPALLNDDPYDKGWMIKIRAPGTVALSGLLPKKTYDAKIAAEKH